MVIFHSYVKLPEGIMIHYDLLWSIAIDCDLWCSFVIYHDLLWSIMIQKWSEHGVFCTFWLGNVLRATTACNFSSLIWPDGSAPAALASLLFRSHKSFEKRKAFRDFPTFSRTCVFFLLTISLLWSSLFGSSPLWLFPPLLFHLSILSEVWLLNFLRLWYLMISWSKIGLHIFLWGGPLQPPTSRCGFVSAAPLITSRCLVIRDITTWMCLILSTNASQSCSPNVHKTWGFHKTLRHTHIWKLEMICYIYTYIST